jgi:hypothetical protein
VGLDVLLILNRVYIVKHFRQIIFHELSDLLPSLQHEVLSNEHLWFCDVSRQTKLEVQRHTQSIPLRAVDRKPSDRRRLENIHASRITPYAASFPTAMSLLMNLANHLGGTLERALYVRLLPHALVYPHTDAGTYYAVRDRYHLVVLSNGGSILKSGDEEVTMCPGELWWFDNKAVHESSNPSNEGRVHLIFDIF